METPSVLRVASDESVYRNSGTLPVTQGPASSLSLCYPCLNYSLNQRCWQLLVERKVDGSLRSRIGAKLSFKHFDDGGCGKQTAVVRKPCNPYENPRLRLKGGNAIANRLNCVARHSGPNQVMQFYQVLMSRNWDCSQVFRKVFRNAFGLLD